MHKLILLSCLLLVFTACATTHPERIPEIKTSELPPLEFKGLKNRKLTLTVKNSRKVNQTAGNSPAVEAAVVNACTDSIQRGGLKIAESENHLVIEIQECSKPPEGAECVLMVGEFATPRVKLTVEGNFTHGYASRGGDMYAFGDVNEAYQGALKLLFEGLDRQYAKLK